MVAVDGRGDCSDHVSDLYGIANSWVPKRSGLQPVPGIRGGVAVRHDPEEQRSAEDPDALPTEQASIPQVEPSPDGATVCVWDSREWPLASNSALAFQV